MLKEKVLSEQGKEPACNTTGWFFISWIIECGAELKINVSKLNARCQVKFRKDMFHKLFYRLITNEQQFQYKVRWGLCS
jgi:hypothetical protein